MIFLFYFSISLGGEMTTPKTDLNCQDFATLTNNTFLAMPNAVFQFSIFLSLEDWTAKCYKKPFPQSVLLLWALRVETWKTNRVAKSEMQELQLQMFFNKRDSSVPVQQMNIFT